MHRRLVPRALRAPRPLPWISFLIFILPFSQQFVHIYMQKHLRFLFPARAAGAENTEIPAHGKAARRDFQYKMEKKEVVWFRQPLRSKAVRMRFMPIPRAADNFL